MRFSNLFRRARRVAAVPYESVTSYTDLLANARPSILWLYEPQALTSKAELLFPDLASAEVKVGHESSGPTPDGVGLVCLKNAVVSGTSLVGSERAIYQLGPAAPLYVDQLLSDERHSKGSPVGRRKLTRRTPRFVPGLSVLVSHCNADVYGHWLLECMPKLLLLRRVADRLPPFRIVLPLSAPHWMVTWIRHILPNAEIETYDNGVEYLRCEKLLLPTLLMYSIHYFHPELVSLLDELCKPLSTASKSDGRFYVSRVIQSHYRELSNRDEIEDIAAAEGLTIVRPETLPVAEQISLFSNASTVVGEFGSSLHNALFSPPQTKVFCLNWINELQSRIAHLKRHRVGYLLPSDGVPVKYEGSGSHRVYRIDPEAFRKYVRLLIALE